MLPYGARCQLLLSQQRCPVLTDKLKAQLIRRTMEVLGELLRVSSVAAQLASSESWECPNWMTGVIRRFLQSLGTEKPREQDRASRNSSQRETLVRLA